MKTIDDYLHEARQKWVVEQAHIKEPKNTTTRVAAKTGYSKGTVSNYLTGKGYMSEEFIVKFCNEYDYDSDAVRAELAAKLAEDLQSGRISLDERTEERTIPNKINTGNSLDSKDEQLILPTTKTELSMLQKTLSMLEKRMDKDDERWDRLLATHDKLVDILGAMGLKQDNSGGFSMGKVPGGK